MTREEAINRIKDHMVVHHIGEYPHIRLKEALDMALSALRPVSREQVEKVWRGEIQKIKNYRVYSGKCQHCGLYIGPWAINRPYPYIFCPYCGEAFTDEAVDILLKRLEALKDAKR